MAELEWKQRFISVGFDETEASKYAGLFVKEGIPLDVGSSLDHALLQSMGINKAGDRIKILRLNESNSTQPAIQTPVVLVRSPDVPCRNHPDREAVAKCVQRNCQGDFCLACVSRTPQGHGYWCHACKQHVQQNALCIIS